MKNNQHLQLVEEDDLTPQQHQAIQTLLVAAYPQFQAIFSAASYWGARPEYRLWLETAGGQLLAHLDFERRVIDVGGVEILIAGVGEVATHPDMQGQGVGRFMMQQLQHILRQEIPVDFGYLHCRPEIVSFYTAVGWHQVWQTVRCINPNTNQWVDDDDPKMILPAQKSYEQWPARGKINLRGLEW